MPQFNLDSLLHAPDSAARDSAWEAFVAEHSRLMLHVARDLFQGHDGAMDAYTFVLERLCDEDFRRLRGFSDDGRSRLTTWLTVVTRRLCLDYYRQRYGRPRAAEKNNGAAERHVFRRRLMDLTTTEGDLAVQLALADRTDAPDAALRQQQLRDAVASAVAQLSAEERLLLTLRFNDGLSGSEIARLMGLPTPFHVFRRLNATFSSLRRLLEARGVENSTP